ncbi:NAD(P)/FAD-dependent oxidoreductase [Candidatus Giovannonibacteria bacterium]|nr:NAD(P)/FAD-dependent oxidoreductase [Candidatus Giovannonibacteria bacterium]
MTDKILEIKYLIIGGGVAGTTAAESIRKKDPAGSIAIVSEEPFRLYSRIMLSKPNFFLEKISFEQVWLKTEAWYKENNIEFYAGKRALNLNTAEKKVTLQDNEVLKYEKLLLAIGGCVRLFGAPGSEKEGVFYLRTLEDAKAVISAVKTAKRAVVIGGGFIGFEMCEMLRLAGVEVTLVLREPYFWQILLDDVSGKMIEGALEKGGVKIIRSNEVSDIIGKDSVEKVILKDGSELPCDMLIVGIGLQCPFSWVEAAGIKVNKGILANEYLETTAPDVWTAGDCAEFQDLILGERIQLANWANAQMQGRRAGLNMSGEKETFRLVSFYTTRGFGISIAFVGDIRPEAGRTITCRGSREANSYARLISKDGELIGATLINRTQEMGAISKVIEMNIKITGLEKELADPLFDLGILVK